MKYGRGGTQSHLHALKLGAMAAAWTTHQQQAGVTALTFGERFALLVEWHARENKRLTRAPAGAQAEALARLSRVGRLPRRELDKAVICQLVPCHWVAEHHNIILVGATGVGKSFLACALGHQTHPNAAGCARTFA